MKPTLPRVMKHINTIFAIALLTNTLIQATSGAAIEASRPVRGLLIFLDDSENSLGAVSGDLMSAIIEEAGPIVASASLIANIRGDKIEPYLKDKTILADAYANLAQAVQQAEKKYTAQPTIELLNKLTKAQQELDALVHKSILSLGAFDAQQAKNWVIKEIDRSLYLLLPKSYLNYLGVDIELVKIFAPESPITLTEERLGFKVNHLPTKDLSAIKKPLPEPRYASYFIDQLPRIFVTSGEYPVAHKNLIPSWGMYVVGHGSAENTIADLKLTQFQDLLNFMEIMIRTRIFVYNSCYAAGVNTELIYTNAEKGITKTYSFPIITQALTDAPTSGSSPSLLISTDRRTGEVHLNIAPRLQYHTFFERITHSGVLKYDQVIAPLMSKAGGKMQEIKNVPQVRLPGLPWFSVLDTDNKTISIGSVLSKTRTEPLNVLLFFKKKGQWAQPLGILLYTQEIPFELIINTTNMPAMVSMIPGDAVHHLKKISSMTQNASAILNSFNLDMEGPEKIFIIDAIQAAPIKSPQGSFDSLTNVVIDMNRKEFRTYFTYQGKVYRKPGMAASANDEKNYRALLQQYGRRRMAPKEQAERKAIERKTVQETLTPQALARLQEVLKHRGGLSNKKQVPQVASQQKNLIASLTELVEVAEKNKLAADQIRVLQHVLSLITEQPYTADVLSLAVDLLSEVNRNAKIHYAEEKTITTINFLLEPVVSSMNKEIKRLG